MEQYEKIQLAILELFDVQRAYEQYMNNSERIKNLYIIITSVVSYADGIKLLMENKKYDSVFPICRSFIELYPSIIYMIENFSDTNEFDKYFKKLVVDDMVQDVEIYKSIKGDSTIPETEEKKSDIASYITRWENNIDKYFPEEKGKIDASDKEASLFEIIKDLNKFYKREYKLLCSSKNKFIGDTLKRNKAVRSCTGKEYGSSYFVYRKLCSETHGNIGSLDDRVIHNGIFSINMNSKNDAVAAADLIYWSIKDITIRFKDLLKNENS